MIIKYKEITHLSCIKWKNPLWNSINYSPSEPSWEEQKMKIALLDIGHRVIVLSLLGITCAGNF